MTEVRGLFEKNVAPLFEGGKSSDWLAEARSIAERIGMTGKYVTVNMVRELLPPPEDVDPRIMGAIFKRKDWERVGYVSSGRSTCHNRPIAIFRLRSYSEEKDQ